MKIAISTCVISDRPVMEFLADLKSSGFTLLELSKRARRQISVPKALRHAGFDVHSVHANVGPDSLYSPDPALRRKALEPVFADIDDAARFGPSRYVLHWVYREPGLPHLHHWRESLGQIINRCQRHRIVLAVETVSHKPQRFYVPTQQIIDTVGSFGSPWAKMCLDTNHTNVKESLPEVIGACGDLLETLHVSDNHGEVEEHLPPGDGTINFDAVVRALQTIEYTGPFNLEVATIDVPVENQGSYFKKLHRMAQDLLERHGAL